MLQKGTQEHISFISSLGNICKRKYMWLLTLFIQQTKHTQRTHSLVGKAKQCIMEAQTRGQRNSMHRWTPRVFRAPKIRCYLTKTTCLNRVGVDVLSGRGYDLYKDKGTLRHSKVKGGIETEQNTSMLAISVCSLCLRRSGFGLP